MLYITLNIYITTLIIADQDYFINKLKCLATNNHGNQMRKLKIQEDKLKTTESFLSYFYH